MFKGILPIILSYFGNEENFIISDYRISDVVVDQYLGGQNFSIEGIGTGCITIKDFILKGSVIKIHMCSIEVEYGDTCDYRWNYSFHRSDEMRVELKDKLDDAKDYFKDLLHLKEKQHQEMVKSTKFFAKRNFSVPF